MPREGTKTQKFKNVDYLNWIEIRYAPGGDENLPVFSNQFK